MNTALSFYPTIILPQQTNQSCYPASSFEAEPEIPIYVNYPQSFFTIHGEVGDLQEDGKNYNFKW